jgi:Rad3-related DNA helicase
LSAKIPELSKLDLAPEGWEWREGQRELAERIAASEKKIVMLEAECGTGKSLIPTGAARALGKTALVLIQTIQLQEQYLRDLRGLVLMKGRSHDRCDIMPELTADRAPCVAGYRCHLRGKWVNGVPITEPGCGYFKKKAAAARAQVSVQNYAFWLRERSGAQSSFRNRDWIICDEGHELDSILMDAGRIEFDNSDLRALRVNPALLKTSVDSFITLFNSRAAEWEADLKDRLAAAGLQYRDGLIAGEGVDVVEPEEIRPFMTDMARARRVAEVRRRLVNYQSAPSEWVVEQPEFSSDHWALSPIFGKYAFRDIVEDAKEKVIIMSAYLAPRLLIKNLGLDPEDVDVIVAPPVFDRRRSPVLYTPIVPLKHKMLPQLQNFYFAMVDEIIDEFGPQKGMIHVPSVALRDMFIMCSRHRDRFIAYDGAGSRVQKYKSKEAALEEFVSAREPKILIGQSISTGVDLPGVFGWQIIAKLPFPPTTSPVIKKRMEVDKTFYSYHTICELVQAAGRAKRSAKYDATTVIVDAQFKWFYGAYRADFPEWFRRSLVYDGWARLPKARAAMQKVAFRTGVQL